MHHHGDASARLTCPVTGKRMHAAKEDAQIQLKVMLDKGLTRMKIFRCGWCETYHVGRSRGHGGGRA